MASLKTYALSVWRVQGTVSRKMGYDFRVADLPVRVMCASTSVMIGAVLRILFLKGVATDAELTSLFDNVQDADYPQLPYAPPNVPEDGTEIPPPDFGA